MTPRAQLSLTLLVSSKFKLPPILGRGQPLRPNDVDEPQNSRNQLGAFARMMLDSTDIAYRCEELSKLSGTFH